MLKNTRLCGSDRKPTPTPSHLSEAGLDNLWKSPRGNTNTTASRTCAVCLHYSAVISCDILIYNLIWKQQQHEFDRVNAIPILWMKTVRKRLNGGQKMPTQWVSYRSEARTLFPWFLSKANRKWEPKKILWHSFTNIKRQWQCTSKIPYHEKTTWALDLRPLGLNCNYFPYFHPGETGCEVFSCYSKLSGACIVLRKQQTRSELGLWTLRQTQWFLSGVSPFSPNGHSKWFLECLMVRVT